MMPNDKAPPTVEVLNETISTSRQGVKFTRIERCAIGTVRFTIESDAYREQCRAVVEVWSKAAMQWHAVHHIPPSLMQTPEGLCYHPDKTGADRKHFLKDHRALSAMAWEILAP
jgi:hypothetical protein